MRFIRRLIRRPSHATIVAYLALFFAMGGTAYAAAKWTGAEIVDGSLTGVDVADNSLTGDDITAGSITSTEIDPDALSVSGGDGANAAIAETSLYVTWDWGFPGDGGSQPAAGPVIAVIPDVGELFVSGCRPGQGEATMGLRNTSGMTLYGPRWDAVPNAPGPRSQDAAPPGGAFVIEYGWGSDDLVQTVVSGEGIAPTVTQLSTATWVESGTCHFAALWTQATPS